MVGLRGLLVVLERLAQHDLVVAAPAGGRFGKSYGYQIKLSIFS